MKLNLTTNQLVPRGLRPPKPKTRVFLGDNFGVKPRHKIVRIERFAGGKEIVQVGDSDLMTTNVRNKQKPIEVVEAKVSVEEARDFDKKRKNWEIRKGQLVKKRQKDIE